MPVMEDSKAWSNGPGPANVAQATFTPEAGGEAHTGNYKGIHIYRRQPDGSWRIAQDIWNSDEAPPAGE